MAKALILFRLLLAPCIVALAMTYGKHAHLALLCLMYLGLISDILDGIIARKTGTSTATLRRMDSQVDMLFWLAIGISTWMVFPSLLEPHLVAIYSILIMEVLCYLISLIKFKKETCTHAFLSKMWGLSLLAAFTSIWGFENAGVPLYITIVLGLISHLDRIAITLLLPHWTHDVPSSYHAYLIRKGKNFKRNIYLNG